MELNKAIDIIRWDKEFLSHAFGFAADTVLNAYEELKCTVGIPAACPECGSINHLMAIQDDDSLRSRVECYNLTDDAECTYCGSWGNTVLEAWENHAKEGQRWKVLD